MINSQRPLPKAGIHLTKDLCLKTKYCNDGHGIQRLEVKYKIKDKQKGQDQMVLPFVISKSNYLQSNNILCLWAFWTLSYCELNFLTFSQGFET